MDNQAKIVTFDGGFVTREYRLKLSQEQYGAPRRMLQAYVQRFVKGKYTLADGTVGEFQANPNLYYHVRLFFDSDFTFAEAVALFRSLGFLNSSRITLLSAEGEETSINRGADFGKPPLIISELDPNIVELLSYYQSLEINMEGFRPMSWRNAILKYRQKKTDDEGRMKREITYVDTQYDKQIVDQLLTATSYPINPK